MIPLNRNVDLQAKYNSKGIVFYNKGDFQSALKWYKKCLPLPNCDKQIYFNIGLCYHSIRDFDNAIKYYEDYEEKSGIDNIYEKSLIYLLSGDHKRGFSIYNKRYGRNSKDGVHFPNLPIPWIDNIKDLKDKNVLILNEQGFGDEFLFSKSVADLYNLCTSAKVQVYPETFNLMKDTYPSIDFFTDRTLSYEFVMGFDGYTSSGELFALYNIDSIKKYEYKESKIDTGRVGIFFAANPNSKNAKKRSINPNVFRKLSNRYSLVNLQKGHKLDFAENPELNDFLDTKKVIDGLDFVISIDSSIANLCGMIGKECCLVNKDYLDWRYINEFYESIHIIKPAEIDEIKVKVAI